MFNMRISVSFLMSYMFLFVKNYAFFNHNTDFQQPFVCMNGFNQVQIKYIIKTLPHISTKFEFRFDIDSESQISSSCFMFIIYSKSSSKSEDGVQLCPFSCHPYPFILVSPIMLYSDHLIEDSLIGCSIHYPVLKFIQLELRKSSQTVLTLSEIVILKRLLECYEPVHWSKVFSYFGNVTQQILRYKVDGVVIWVGSQDKISLIKQQSLVLQHGNFLQDDKPSTVIPWAAVDSLYPCRNQSTRCNGKGNSRFKYLPQSAINFMPEGWRCAQRRPLRALAHVLALFDPEYVVLLDDDTFFNYPVFWKKYSSFVEGPMAKTPIILGEFTGRTGEEGHISKKGILAGGSGYVLGKDLLNKLVEQKVVDFENESLEASEMDVYRSRLHKEYLSVSADELKHENRRIGKSSECIHSSNWFHSCLAGHDLIVSQKQQYFYQADGIYGEEKIISLPVSYYLLTGRLIDLCVDLMAGEHTCQHSDHSIGRCMIYGARASAVGAVCHSFDTSDKLPPNQVRLGFCFSTPECDISTHVTCHRYKASLNQNNVLQAVRLPEYEKTRFKYSSGFDGNITDSYL